MACKTNLWEVRVSAIGLDNPFDGLLQQEDV